jgi:hypothetical protein
MTYLKASLHSIVYTGGYLLLRPLVRVHCHAMEALPPNAIVYAYHEILLPGILASRCTKRMIWVNNDTPGGLASALPALLSGLRIFRLATHSSISQYEQLSAFLGDTNVPVGILTDAGLRDRRVRASLTRLAIHAGRPLVPLTVNVSSYKRIDGQIFPLPFATITVRTGLSIPPERLAGMDPEDATNLLQKNLDFG